MTPFLSAVAQYYVDSLAPADWERTVFVFPNHRSSVFFSNALCSVLGRSETNGEKVIFGLRITTLGDLLRKGADLSVADQVTLRCELYRAYKEVVSANGDEQGAGAPRHDFDSFYSWAGVIINDFSDIDKSLVEPVKIYSNITSLQQLSDEMEYLSDRQRKAIEDFWHVLFEEAEDALGNKKLVHKRFVEDFQKMDRLYKLFRSNLLAKDLVYPAMLLREAAENPMGWKWDEDDVRYVFIGFSLLCPAEESIMRRLSRARNSDGRPRADFFWDFQPSMLKEPDSVGKHGAGYAIKRWANDPDFKAPFGFMPPEGVRADEQNVTLIETAYSLSQTYVLAHLLEERQAGDSSTNTVIVLPDQQMLLPVMSAIPESVTDVNVTMGYELRFSQVSSFAKLLADILNPLWLRFRKDDGTVLFNVKAVLPILRHPYVVRCDGLEQTRRAVRKIIDGNMAFISRSDVAGLKLAESILGLVPENVKSLPIATTDLPVSALCSALQRIFASVYNSFAESGERDLDRETIWEALKVVRRLGVVFDLVKDDVADVRTLTRILCSMIDQQKVDFQGMPFGGLQVMGILETRAIDFDNVIILDMIEGAWPPPRQSVDTMIPLFLRNANKMVTPDDVDSTYNYYFYRLKSRARNITFIRPTAVSGTRQSQLSRYVLQLKMLQRQNVNVVSAQKCVAPMAARRFEIDKRSVADILARDPLTCGEGVRGLRISPSGLSDYVSCPMMFYFKRVVNLRLDDEINEEADARQLGLIYHAVMETLYRPKGVVLSDDLLSRMLSKEFEPKLDRLILEKFCEVLNAKHILSPSDLGGRNILTFFTLKKIVRLTLMTEVPGTIIVDTEERIDDLVIKLPSGKNAVLTGSVDRQHISPSADGGGSYFVADYKTGAVETMNVATLYDLFDPQKHKKNKAILQVMMYCYFLRHKQDAPLAGPLTPYVIKVKGGLSRDWHDAQSGSAADVVQNRVAYIGGKNDKRVLVYEGEVEALFERLLAEKIDEIFDVNVPFRQVDDPDLCGNCDFKNICKR